MFPSIKGFWKKAAALPQDQQRRIQRLVRADDLSIVKISIAPHRRRVNRNLYSVKIVVEAQVHDLETSRLPEQASRMAKRRRSAGRDPPRRAGHD
jgi:hypothetical protein